MANENLKLSPEIEQFTQKLVADPKSRIFAQLADAYRKAGMIDEAIETAKKGLGHHPAYATAHLILGRCYLEKQMYALAREEFESTIKNDPQNLVGYKLLAGTYEKQNMFAEAVKFYQMVLDMEPSDIDLAEKVASLKTKQDERPQAVPEPEPVPQPAPVLEMVREETETAPVKEEPAAAAEEKTLELESKEPVKKEEAAFSAGAIPFPEVLAETETEVMPILESPQPESEPKEEKPAVKEETSETPEPIQVETGENPVKAEEPETKAEEKSAATVTLAEIYVQQGFYEKAVEVYRELISAEPDNGDYKARMDELLEKAYPEATPETVAEDKKEPESSRNEEATGPVQEPIASLPEILDKLEPPAPEPPVIAAEEKKESIPEALSSANIAADISADIFGGMFDKLEPKVAESKPSEQDDILAKAFAPAEHSNPMTQLTEKKPEPQPIPEPTKETPVDFSALFSDAPKTQDNQASAEPEKKAESENTVSSFQSWLSSLQK